MFAYNTSVHSTTGFTPYFLMFGVEARLPSEILLGLPVMERTPAPYAFHRYQKLCVAYEAARESTYTAAKRAKDYYDMGAIQKQFQVGDNGRIRVAPLNRHPHETALQMVQAVPRCGSKMSTCHGGGSGDGGLYYCARR